MIITSASAIDSNNWKSIEIENHEFKIPPKYSNGELKKDTYTVGNWRNFEISPVDDSLPTVYGFANSEDPSSEDIEINGHAVRYFNGYNNAEKANVSKVFFSVGQSIYMISWKSNEFSEDVKNIISLSDSSNFTSDEFYDILDEALNQYNYQKQVDLNTPDPVYIQSSNHHGDNDFIKYYLLSRASRHRFYS